MKKTKTCPACLSDIPEMATKCRFCATTQIEAVVASAKPSTEFTDSGLSKTCKDCCRQVDKNARRCPYCRALLKTHPFTMCCAWLFGITFVFMFFGALISGCESGGRAAPAKPVVSGSDAAQNKHDTPVTTQTKKGPDDIQCWGIAKQIILSSLKSPSTAEFPSRGMFDETSPYSVTDKGDVYTVASYVDSQNGFGAMVRSNWIVKMKYLGGDVYNSNSWEILDVKID